MKTMTELFSKNWKKLTAIVVGVGLFGLMVGNFVPFASVGGILPADPCDGGDGFMVHWDKIVFSSPGAIKKPDTSFIPKGELLDIRVPTIDPFEVTDLRQAVIDQLNSQGYTRSNDSPMLKHLIDIVDVDYAIGCFNQGPIVI